MKSNDTDPNVFLNQEDMFPEAKSLSSSQVVKRVPSIFSGTSTK